MNNVMQDILGQMETNQNEVNQYQMDNTATIPSKQSISFDNNRTPELQIQKKQNSVDGYQLKGGKFEYAKDPKYTEKLKQVHDGLTSRISQTFGNTNPDWNSTSDIVNVLTMKTQRDTNPYFMFGNETTDVADGIKKAYKMGIDPIMFLAQIKQETGGRISNVMKLNNTTGGVTYSQEAVQKYKKYGIELLKGSKRPDGEGGYYAKTKTLADGILLHAIVLNNFKKGS